MELKTIFFSGLVIFNNYRMFTFLVSNSDVDYRLVEKYFPNSCWTTPIGKLARATRDWIISKFFFIEKNNSDTEFYLRFVLVYTTTHEKLKLLVFQNCVE